MVGQEPVLEEDCRVRRRKQCALRTRKPPFPRLKVCLSYSNSVSKAPLHVAGPRSGVVPIAESCYPRGQVSSETSLQWRPQKLTDTGTRFSDWTKL